MSVEDESPSESEGAQDKAPPGGDGSHKAGKGEWQPPTDGSWLPKVRVDEMVGDLRAQLARKDAELKAAQEVQSKAQEKTWTRAELNQLVADGKITQDAADLALERQLIDRATRQAKEAASTEVAQREREAALSAQLKAYRRIMPEAWDAGSKQRAKVAKEYSYLVEELGYPETKATEVAALRAAFGDHDTIKAARATGRAGPGETHMETGGGERPEAGGESAEGPPKGLDARQKAYYERQIQAGRYKDWKAVREELKFARPAKA